MKKARPTTAWAIRPRAKSISKSKTIRFLICRPVRRRGKGIGSLQFKQGAANQARFNLTFPLALVIG
jgi:hypothetical protein